MIIYSNPNVAPKRTPLDAETCFAALCAHVGTASRSTAALLAVEGRLRLDTRLRQASLVIHPGLLQMLAGQPAKRRVIDEACLAVLGDGWRWEVVPGAWTHAEDAEPALTETRAPESPFERLKRTGPDGHVYWSSRELAQVLGYRSARAFTAVLEKARQACANSGHDVAAHFVREPETKTTRLSRYACYLVVQNASPAKVSVALGQTYLAAQARRQEVADEVLSMEDQRRLMLRQEVAAHNKRLAASARNAGVTSADEFREFQNQGYRGLYGGLSAGMLRRHKRLDDEANVLDHMGSTELAANLFRATQTDEKIRRDRVNGAAEACRLHHRVGEKVRQAMAEISGVMPEDLPVVEDINAVRRRVKRLAAAEAPAPARVMA